MSGEIGEVIGVIKIGFLTSRGGHVMHEVGDLLKTVVGAKDTVNLTHTYSAGKSNENQICIYIYILIVN